MKKLYTYFGYRHKRSTARIFGGGGINGREKGSARD